MATITEIAQQLKDVDEYIVIIYAFNSTGKTRLSVAYKDITKAENGGIMQVFITMLLVKTFLFGTMMKKTIMKI